MAVNRWISKQAKRAQVNTVTPANVNIGNLFLLTINAKSETFTATAATVANVTAGAPPLWNDSDEGEMDEATAADGTTLVTITADEPGVPFTQTTSASGGTATFTTATTVASLSPNDNNDAVNWTDGIPTASDDVIFDAGGTAESVWWNLGALSAITLTSLTRRRAYTGRIGLEEYNTGGQNTFFEYRATELAISATTELIEQPSSDGVAHIKRNQGSVQTALTILGDGPSQLGDERMWWRGTHASNVVNVVNGSLAIAPVNANAATVLTLRGENATIRCGSAVTLTTVTSLNSLMEFNSAITTLTQKGENAVTYIKGSAAITTANIAEGTYVHQSSGTITTLTPGFGCTLDFSQGSGPVTITNAVTFPAGVTLKDPNGRVVFSGGWVLAAGVRLSDVSLDFGTARTFTVS